MKNQFRAGLCQLETKNNKTKIYANFGNPLSSCFKVEIFEASSVRVEFDGAGNVINFTVSGLIPKEGE
jgi:hypothetical protein